MPKSRLPVHISIVSLNLKMPLAFMTPLTPSGMRYAQSATPTGSVVCKTSILSDWLASSDVSATNTRPSSFTVSTRAGTTFYKRRVLVPGMKSRPKWLGREAYMTRQIHTSRLERHINPMKLLLCAIRAESLMDIEARPLLLTSGRALTSRAKSRI
ncbi:hypothetical protein BP00DRAFT_204084 [Aspergillus indologenus CBS 114.80]|uniref:Uncharacterized protein n=1 Tax=Aspergillus indologenus CBS 114.80 TaxID=1450541 RepID=A0A2V5I158_9EURO|nr:hypothetical protein BP00DRAFT_204084 [Aspergillus indologenus CBS 114.80]